MSPSVSQRRVLIAVLPLVAGVCITGFTAAPTRAAQARAVEAAARQIAARPGVHRVRVHTSAQLTAALAGARPGDLIRMAAGVYTSNGDPAPRAIGGQHYYGTFVTSRSGTAARPITLRGPRSAVIDGMPGGNGTGTQYGLYLAGANHWRVQGITVRNVQKGIVLDASSHVVIQGVAVTRSGDEGIHLRAGSSHDTVKASVVRNTGRHHPVDGEGIYVGSARSKWGTYAGGRPDASNHDRLIGNLIRGTRAESIDIKEGTTGGLVRGNRFNGVGMMARWADSWVDAKGNGWRILGNRGVRSPLDGFQVHRVAAGWGRGNVFARNRADVRARGYGFRLAYRAGHNVVRCNNVVAHARSGFANVRCTR